MLDQITDPHNVGAIFRSAAAFAATAIVTTQRHSARTRPARWPRPPPARWRIVPLVSVQNLARGLAALKAERLPGRRPRRRAAKPISPRCRLRAPLALVLGAEGKGLRQLTKETCDHVARIDLPGAIKSLNVSNAAAVALYVASRHACKAAETQNGGPPARRSLPLALQTLLFAGLRLRARPPCRLRNKRMLMRSGPRMVTSASAWMTRGFDRRRVASARLRLRPPRLRAALRVRRWQRRILDMCRRSITRGGSSTTRVVSRTIGFSRTILLVLIVVSLTPLRLAQFLDQRAIGRLVRAIAQA